jgi:hypothetical protein
MVAATVVVALAACNINPLPDPIESAPAGPFQISSQNVDFEVNVLDRSSREINGEINVSISSYDVEGRMANYIDEENGETRPGPQIMNRLAPWEYTATLGPRVVTVTITATVLHAATGDQLVCRVAVNGKELPIRPENVAVVAFPGEPVTAVCTQTFIPAPK